MKNSPRNNTNMSFGPSAFKAKHHSHAPSPERGTNQDMQDILPAIPGAQPASSVVSSVSARGLKMRHFSVANGSSSRNNKVSSFLTSRKGDHSRR